MRLFRDTNTTRFLKQRNVRLTVRQAEGQSFYVLRVSPRTTIAVPGDTLRFQIKVLPNKMVRISLYSQAKQQLRADLTVPNNPAAGTLKLVLDDVLLDIDIDAAE